MRFALNAAAVSALLGGCVETVDLGVPEPEGRRDMGVDLAPDVGEPDVEPPDLGTQDEHVPPLECSLLERPECVERVDCDWYGGDAGFCAEAGPCDELLTQRDCVTHKECDWEGEAGGFCVPTVDDPTDCSDLWLLHCEETLGCTWGPGEFGECSGVPVTGGCRALTHEQCNLHDRCRWYGELDGFCDDAVPCGGQDWEGCVTRASCDWEGDIRGFCVPTTGEVQGCAEASQVWCREAGCEWVGLDFGECTGVPNPAPGCDLRATEPACVEDRLCDWYGSQELGFFCDRVTQCDEVESHGACVVRAACDWEGESTGYCRPAVGDPDACSGEGFLGCRHRAPECEWVGGDWGECALAR